MKNEINGFKVLRKIELADLEGEFVELEHLKTGARVIAILNEDPNKVFYIGFKTPSPNSTGVAHILEHSTLCGSRKYEVKEPFVELAKGSINTFLNAMTYPDKTVYPIATTVDKDFRNMMDVYLDAVFYPKAIEEPKTFMQEGWHYHIEEEDQPITLNGVVYNEMKGVYSSPESLVEDKLYAELYPDTIYGQDSGGNPDHIPELTYENFVDFYKTLYHPSNSYIYLYGDLDLEDQLDYLNSWLDEFEREETLPTIEPQNPGEVDNQVIKTFSYPAKKEDKDEKNLLAVGYVLDKDLTFAQKIALDILVNYLFAKTTSIVYKEIVDAGLAEDIDFALEDALLQPTLSVIFKNINVEDKEEILKRFDRILKDLVTNGFSKKDLRAYINNQKFDFLELLGGESGRTPKGLIIGLTLLNNWLYGRDPEALLHFNEAFDEIEKLYETDGFEKLLEQQLLNNQHTAKILLTPDEELRSKNEKQIEEKLEAYKNSLSKEEVEELVNQTKELIKFQNRVDSEEALAKIPHIKVDEINEKRKEYAWEEEKIDGTPLFFVDNPKSDIFYLDFYFDLKNLTLEEIKLVPLLSKLFSTVHTKNFTDKELSNEIDTYTGGVSSVFKLIGKKDTDDYTTHMLCSVGALIENYKKAVDIFSEVLFNSLYDVENDINVAVKSTRANLESRLQDRGNAYAAQRAMATFNKKYRLMEELFGISGYNFIKQLDAEEDFEDLIEPLQNLSKKILNRNNLVLGLVCDKKYKDEIIEKLKEVLDKLESKEEAVVELEFEELPETGSLITSGTVQYNAQAGKIDSEFNLGAAKVLQSILSMGYLWEKVRVLGGAYGANIGIKRDGTVVLSTFRDPHLKKTYENFEKMSDYLDELDLTQDQIDHYIIGTISPYEVPETKKQEMRKIIDMVLGGYTNDDFQKTRTQILNTDFEDLEKSSKALKEVLKQKNYYTVGSEKAIIESTDQFENIQRI